jgi:hypothetical protein
MKWKLTPVLVTVLSGAATGASSANAALAAPSFIISAFPIGLAGSDFAIESVTLNTSTGVVTVVTQANVATANLQVRVIVATPMGN